MKRTLLVGTLVLAALMFAAAPAYGQTYSTPTECYDCHGVTGTGAVGKVDFDVPAVDYAKCATCHSAVIGASQLYQHWHRVSRCSGCHAVDQPPLIADPALWFLASFQTPYGVFVSAASLARNPEILHSKHAGNGWVNSLAFARSASCQPCHQPAACSSCHVDSVGHTDHAVSRYPAVSYLQATGTGTTTEPSTCVNSACHDPAKAATAEFVPWCGSCHPARVDEHGYDTIDHVADDGAAEGIACSACHSLDLATAHGDAGAEGASCATCHPMPRKSFDAWDQSCATGGCHTPTSTAPMHANTAIAHQVDAKNTLCLDCHTGTELGSIHVRAKLDTGETSCLVCHSASAAPSTRDCTTCHFTFENHYDTIAHSSYPIGCSGTGCHTTPDLMTVHNERNEAFSCGGCHSSVRIAVQDAIDQGDTSCTACHGAISGLGGHRDAHDAQPPLMGLDDTPNYSYYTGSVGTMPTGDCGSMGCHTSNLVDEHVGLILSGPYVIAPRYDDAGNPLTCGTCHDQPEGSIVQTAIAADQSACESCHDVHGPLQVVHTSTFVDDPDMDCSGCHSADLRTEHNGEYTSSAGLTGCDVCHNLYTGMISGSVTGDASQAAISVTNDTRCSACHTEFHTDITPHVSTDEASLACAECHGTVVAGELDVNAFHPKCSTCHSAATGRINWTTATMECTSCHVTQGVDYHDGMTAHFAPDSAGCQVSGCHHTSPDVSVTHSECSMCHDRTTPIGLTTACANCHKAEGTDYHYAFAVKHTPTDTYSTGCATCHDTTDVTELHVTDGCNTCHFITGCNDCHTAHGTHKTTGCQSCHSTEGADYHAQMEAGHTFDAMDPSCTAAGCHAANTLPEEHERFLADSGYASTCDLCHKNTDPSRINWTTAKATCSSCHTVHGDIATIHTATDSGACVDCHESADTRDIHLKDDGTTDCAMCHAAPASRIDWAAVRAAADGVACVNCHGTLSPVDPNHYPLAAHDATAETGCNQCHYMDMKAEHFKSTVAVSCVTCHELKVDSFTTVWDKTCAACHPTTDHSGYIASHVSTTAACGGAGCHDISDVAVLHGATDGPGCGACHKSAEQPASTTDCTAAGCHAGVGTDHRGLHEAASVNPTGCSGCHFMNLVDEHEALGFTCDTCHKSTVSTVVSTIAADDLRCKSCHTGAHGNHAWEFNPGRASVHRVSADLPGMRSSFVVNGTTYTWSLPSASTFLKTGWTTSSMMECSDCHSYSGATGPHGATMKVNIDPAYPNPYRVTTGSESNTAQLSKDSSTGMSMTKSGSANAKMICEKCHDLVNGSTWSNVVHKEHGDRGRNGAYCNSCHIGLPHGWSRPRMIGYTTDSAPYATYTGGVQRISLKSYSPNGWSKSDCGAGCSSSRHPISGSSWPATDVAPPAPTTGTVSGTVKDSATNAAIAGATVSVAGKTATSGSTGAYTVADITEGTYTMTVSATGYDAWSGSVTVTAGQTATADATLTLTTVAPTATNIARTGTASASSTDGSNYASRAIDGNTSSYWRSSSGGTQWLRVDLASAKTFDKVVVNWDGSRYAKAYRIETSNDGSSWTSRYSTSRGSGGTETITFSSVSARYVRIYMTTTNDSHYRITEFEVWGY